MSLGESPKFFFKKHFCVAAHGGTLCFGKVTTIQHELFFEKDQEVSLSMKKLCEFKVLLRTLGKTFASGPGGAPSEEMQHIEIASNEIMYVKGKCLGKKIKETNIFEIEFDPFSYLNFLFAVRDTCLFICHPTKIQFDAMVSYDKATAATMSEKIVEVCEPIMQTNMQRFMLEEFLRLFSPLIDFYSDVRKLLEGRK